MTFKRAIIAYFPHKRMENTGNKKIIFFAIMKPLSGVLKNANQNTKKGLLSWKTKTLKQINLLH
ncbi:type I restriction endonuclease [Helicobacter pylori]|uniref:type I restriction endonuclease n=1 Tax=Helicobacter pylori TaxID=210 RepID=UPI001E4F4199|nr:type I restriction endonuclease [Helicobacter pylori]